MSCALGKYDNYHEIDAQVGDSEDRWKSTFECFPLFLKGCGLEHNLANNFTQEMSPVARL